MIDQADVRLVQIRGDLWSTVHADAVVVTTNGDVTRDEGKCVMGRGVAQQARDRFPGIDKRLGDLIKQYENRCMRVMKVPLYPDEPPVWIVSFPVKDYWQQRPARLSLIAQSARQLLEITDKFGFNTVVMPRPGCGNGGLRWDKVLSSGALDCLMDDLRFVVVTRDE